MSYGINQYTTEHILLVSAHPDDIEVMLGNQATVADETGLQAHAFVASSGEASSVNYSSDRRLCR